MNRRLEDLQALRLAMRGEVVTLPSDGKLYGIKAENIQDVSIKVSSELILAFLVDEGWAKRSPISILIPELINGVYFFGILLRGNKKEAQKLRARAAKWLDEQIKLEKSK